MGMKQRRTVAILTALIGASLIAAGAALIYPPAAFIVAGLALAAAGVFGIDVDGGTR